MAKIVKTNAQEDALREITDNIRIIARYSAVLASGPVEISVTGGGKNRTVLRLVDAEKMVREARAALVKATRALSRKYSIALDESDEAVLSGEDGKPAEPETEPETTTEPETEAEGEDELESGRDYRPVESGPGSYFGA